MEALLTAFVAAGLAEWGDKTQLLTAALAVRYRRPAPILAGVAVVALANALIAAVGGVVLHDLITLRAIALLVALALLFAGVAGLIRQQRPAMGSTWKLGAFLTAASSFFLAEFGDKTQFITGALAAHYDSLALTVAGATAGVIAANAPAALLGDRFAALMPLAALRRTIACLFLLAAFLVAINALRLI